MVPRWLAVVAWVLVGCGFDGNPGALDADPTRPDGVPGDPDAAAMQPDAAPIQPDAAPPVPACARLALGSDHSCALRAGAVYCWGQNAFGELGGGSATTPVTLGMPAVSLGSRSYSTCAARTDGTVACWGLNDSGQLGDGSTTTRASPVIVQGMTGAVEVATGRGHTCARRGNGTLRCWGNNGSGQLGDGTFTQRLTAVADVGSLPAVTQVALGGSHTCAHDVMGAAWCWGENGFGQLGDGGTTDRNVPYGAPVTGVLQIGPASFSSNDGLTGAHTCALTAGAVRCWGDNTMGQLGDGTGVDSATPVTALGLSDAVQIAMGRWHVCARRAGGTVMCWGRNLDGEVGDGSRVQKNSPVPVMGLTDVVEIGAGGYHSCALTGGGALFCWGYNASGQLGDGTGNVRQVLPVPSVDICP